MTTKTLTVPHDPAWDNTIALMREGYRFVANRCERFGTDGFETRLMLRNALCLRGAEAARLFYGESLFTRKGAMPPTTLRLLQDKGSVQSLDGAAHRHRKAMFVGLLIATPPDRMVALFDKQWSAALADWQRKGEVEFFGAVNLVLTRAVAEWAGLPREKLDEQDLCRRLVDMVEQAGHVGPRMWATLVRRAALERQARKWIEQTRRVGGEDTPLRRIAEYRDENGNLLDPAIAAVELINLLRPIVAIGRYIVFAAMALRDHPQWRQRFAAGDERRIEAFAEEVRRFYPFFPMIGGVALRPFTWSGKRYDKGQWVLLDLYGTNHHAFASPDQFDPERDISWQDQGYDFVPQGAGDPRHDHRCPGERMTLALMVASIRWLAGKMSYEIPLQDLTVRLNRLPALPESGFMLANIKVH